MSLALSRKPSVPVFVAQQRRHQYSQCWRLDVTIRNASGKTALHVASDQGLADVVEVLLAQPDVAVNAIANNGLTPLHYSIRSAAIARLLLESGANVNAGIPYPSSQSNSSSYSEQEFNDVGESEKCKSCAG